MESLYHQTNALLEQTQGYFVRLEQGSVGEDSNKLQLEIRSRLDTMWSNTERLDMLAGKEQVQRRQAARQRVDQLKYDIQHLNAALQSMVSRASMRAQEAQDRELLLSTQFTTNDAGRESETSIMIDRALEHQTSLTRTNRYMDDMLGQGASILENLREQRGTLKGAQKKMLDVFNTLGMSNTVIRLIDRRAQGDKYILMGGMLATCVFMWIIVRIFT
eukprot:GFUD01005239.1.p1 GENE.GFUD01005239.1~~GFUD01005239.1.p1  ORF type:complete len:236 (-),score=62.16 GFUD01005239.1:132-785(-)